MRETLLTLLVLGALAPDPASAQIGGRPGWSVVPALGFGVVRVNDSWNSGGMEAGVEVGYGGPTWGWDAYGSMNGLGVACSHVCFDGGPALTTGPSVGIGRLQIGAGAGAMKQFGSWRLLPYGRVSLLRGPLRFDLKVEVPQQDGVGVYFPLMVGVPIGPR